MTTSFPVTAGRRFRLSFAVGGCFALAMMSALIPGSVRAADDPVLAKVDGSEIRKSDVAMAMEELGPSLAQMDPATRDQNVLSLLINMKVAVKAAEDKKIGDSEEFKKRLAFARDQLLMADLLTSEGKAAVTDAAVKKFYDDEAKRISAEQEVHARHILVDTEEEAKAVKAELDKGADFAELAKKKSKAAGPGDGGDLGFFSKDQMVKEVSDVAFSLEPGKISDPVKSQFGWHIIKVEEKRNRKPPEFTDEVKSEIQNILAENARRAYFTKLREAAKVERFDKPEAAAKPDAKAPADKAPAAPADSAHPAKK